jgi:SAM-dependent methyltransferase
MTTGAKWIITDEFSKHADLYDLYAFVQNRAASEFAKFIFDGINEDYNPHFLEIGCGTGLFSIEIIKLFPDAKLHLTDISNEMLTRAFLRVISMASGRVEYELLDGENIPDVFETQADTLISAFTLQWFFNPIDSIKQYQQKIPNLRRIYLSFPTSGSFPQWKYFAKKADVPFTANELPDPQRLQNELESGVRSFRFEKLHLDQVYSNSFDFFNSMKHIGAGFNVKNEGMSTSMLRKLIRTWDTACPSGVTVTHEVAFIEILI